MTLSFALVLLMAMAPAFTSLPYYLGILILAAIYAYIGISWNIVSGLTGQLLIAHIIFIALGGYTTIVLLNTYSITPWIGLLVGGVVAALAGVVIAFIT